MKKQVLLIQLLLLWCFITTAADIHVNSPSQSIQTAINSASSGDQIIVHAGTYNQNPKIIGRSNLTLTSAGDGVVIIQGNGTTVDVIEIQNSSNITVSNFTIKNIRKVEWSTGIYVHGSGNNIQILNNNITDISYHGGAWNAGDNPSTIVGVNPLMVSGDNSSTALTNITVAGNTVSYCMTGWNESITIKANVDGFTVDSNTVHHVTNIAIDAYGLGSWPNTAQTRNGTISSNIVYNAICNYTDNGGIYVDGGKDIVIENNTVYNSLYGYTIGCENQGNVSGGATSGIKLINNIAYNNARAAVMIGTGGDDDGSQGDVVNCLLSGNTFLKNSTSNQWGSELVLQNCSNITLYNNIFSGLWQQMVTEGPGGTGVGNIGGYNIFYNPVGSPLIAQEVNNWATISLAAWKGQISDGSSTFANPLLVNASPTSPDFHLQSTSPAINAGNPGFTPIAGEVDLDGHARVQNSRVDIGVDESGSGGGSAPAAPSSLSATATSSSQINLSWADNSSNETGFRIERKTGSGGTYSEIATVGSNITAYNSTGLSASTTYYYRVRAYNGTGNSSYSNQSNATTQASGGSLPSPWVSSNIGSVGQTGSAGHSSGTFTVSGSGADIWGTSDQFRYVYQQVTGDVTLTARVATLGNTDPWAKGGVMIRNSLGANSQHAFTAVTSTNGTAFQRRVSSGGTSTHTAGSGSAPYWVRIQRSGNSFISYVSSNGTSWTQIGSETISMGSTVYVGLAVTSHNNSTSCTATFNNINLTTGGGGGTSITIDGNLSDWSGVSAIATGSGTAQSLKVYDDGTYLYFGIAGSGLGAHYQVMLNTDNNTSSGYQHWGFGSSGADYYVEDGNVAVYSGSGTNWSWTSVGSANQYMSGSSVREVRVAKSLLGQLGSTITVGFVDINSSWSLVSTLGFASFSTSGSRIGSGEADEINELTELVRVYPNPVQEDIFVDVKNLTHPVEISIHTLDGRLLYLRTSDNTIERIRRNDINGSGVLILSLKSAEIDKSIRLIVK
ncbi:MAG: fibronectin type III domain-containing protein [Marinoscillum sp.]